LHEFSLKYLRCVRCKNKLDLEILNQKNEVIEGFLYCNNCKLTFPIISKVPILWDNFISYISTRMKLGSSLYLKSNNKKLKSFLKKSLSSAKKSDIDRTPIEERWTKIYQKSTRSRFYSTIKNTLSNLPKSNLALEYGCSIGIISNFISNHNEITFGIDRSFSAISVAKKNQSKNLDYFVSDSISHPFANQKFGLVVALNLLELVEPTTLIEIASKQIKKGTFVLSDPYDFDRGKDSVKNSVTPKLLRKELNRHGFHILQTTKKPSFIPWNLKLNPRAQLNYKVDLVISKK